jgi:alkylhydroperoxidase family enzyme
MDTPRIAPLEPPYPPETQRLFDLVMPAGVEPLRLFRTLSANQRIFPRFMRAGVLDRGPVEIRDRELVILRTTARCHSEYEWGVHVAAFARPLGFSEQQIRASVVGGAEDPAFGPRQRLLVRLCDALHDECTISDGLWAELSAEFESEVLVELVYTVGLYHAVSFLTNGLRIENEAYGERFPAGGAG